MAKTGNKPSGGGGGSSPKPSGGGVSASKPSVSNASSSTARAVGAPSASSGAAVKPASVTKSGSNIFGAGAPSVRPASSNVDISKQKTDKKASQAVDVAKAYQRATTPTTQASPGATSPFSGQSITKKVKEMTAPPSVKSLTKQVNQLISGITDKGLADPKKYQKLLKELKAQGQSKLAKDLEKQKDAAINKAKGGKGGKGDTNYVGLTKEDLDKALDNFKASLDKTDADTDTDKTTTTTTDTTTTGSSSSSDWESTYASDLKSWLDELKKEQKSRAEDYASMTTDAASEEGEFDPDTFRSLLGELESSKYRQKMWNERSAKEAYKY